MISPGTSSSTPLVNVLPEVDRIRAEQLIRSTVLAVANGAPVQDINELVRRNAGSVTHADLLSGRLPSNILGDIIGTVEQAKGAAPFNWNSATQEQIGAYLASRGLSHLLGSHGMGSAGLPPGSADAAGGSNGSARSSYRLGELAGAGSSGALADYARQYAGMGFAPGTIGTFANVGLAANDFRQIEQRWGRPETVRAARRTEELGLRGRKDVDDSAGTSEREHDLNRQYLRATTPEEKERIRALMRQEPPRQGETPEQQEQRQRRRLERLDQVNQRDAQQNPDRARTNTDSELQSNQTNAGIGQGNTSSAQNHMGQRAGGRADDSVMANLLGTTSPGVTVQQAGAGNSAPTQQSGTAGTTPNASPNSTSALTREAGNAGGSAENGTGGAGSRPTHAARTNAGPTPA